MQTNAPGARLLIRDEEWLVRRGDPFSDGGYLMNCDGLTDLVGGRFTQRRGPSGAETRGGDEGCYAASPLNQPEQLLRPARARKVSELIADAGPLPEGSGADENHPAGLDAFGLIDKRGGEGSVHPGHQFLRKRR